jgi:hypothetical protein
LLGADAVAAGVLGGVQRGVSRPEQAGEHTVGTGRRQREAVGGDADGDRGGGDADRFAVRAVDEDLQGGDPARIRWASSRACGRSAPGKNTTNSSPP